MINLFDLNRDGYLDLLFNQTHDYSTRVDSVLYSNGKDGFVAERRKPVPADGGYRALTADLNGDGFADVVVANRFNGVTHRLNSAVYRGTREGWNFAAPVLLPTLGATGVAAGDFNGDGHTDLVLANGGSLEAFTIGKLDDRRSYLYWGSSEGYSASQRAELAAVNPTGVAAADLNRDGLPDIVLANSGTEAPGIYIYWNSPGGLHEANRQALRAGDPTGVLLADLDGNGYPEIVLSQRNDTALILSNLAGAFSEARSLSVEAPRSSGACAGDLDGDGRLDLVLVGGAGTFVFTGGMQDRRPTVLDTTHATACSIADLNGDSYPDLAVARYRDSDSYDIGSLVFWGAAAGLQAKRARWLT
jgi:hypothetical protein